MNELILVLQVVSILCSVVFAAVAYQFMKAAYVVLRPRLVRSKAATWLFRIPRKRACILFALCFVALAL